jgi:NhaP-type Na+/H+ or K+/H+ antiporter
VEKTGKILGVPYDFRFPTPARIKERMWNLDDPRVITPRVFGAGWTINFATLREKNQVAFVIALVVTALIYINGLHKLCKKLARFRGGSGKD